MSNIKDKIYDWKDRLKSGKMLTLVVTLVIIIIILGIYAMRKARDYRLIAENDYNNAFYQLVEYVNNTEKLLAKSTISNSSVHGTETLGNISKQTSLAQAYLSMLPIKTEELENTQKFLNQLGDYSYTLSKKTIKGEKLSQEDLDRLDQLHTYSLELENTLNQLETDLYSKNIKWGELKDKGDKAFGKQDDNISKNSFSNIEEDLHQYEGLIYDGAFSENVEKAEKIGLTGDEISKDEARELAKKYIGEDKFQEIEEESESENARIECYSFVVKTKGNNTFNICISKKGGHLLSMNCNREISSENVKEEDAINIGKKFLKNRKYDNMKETYYLKENGTITINYAYMQKEVVMYPDLIKVKIALDNGEVLGIEATNYLNSHNENRNLKTPKITKGQALELVNPKLEIISTDMAIIPTEWNTEIQCWEIKGKTSENDFIIYINVETGEEEDILMIIDTPNGTLTA